MFAPPTDKTFAEFFAGIGLVRAGLARGGWTCAYANDIAAEKATMYRGHFRDVRDHYHVADVRDVEAVVARVAAARCFLATASFPCVDLSLAGHWKGLDGTQSSTFFGFTDVLRRLGEARPRLVMLENVYGLLTSNGGDDLDRVIGEVADCGYRIDAIVLDARRFVPQSRPRLFIFGFHEQLRGFETDAGEDRVGLFGRSILGPPFDARSLLRPPALVDALRRARSNVQVANVRLPDPPAFVSGLAASIDLGGEEDWWGQTAVEKHLAMMEEPSRLRVAQAVAAGSSAVGAAFRRTRRGATRLEVRFDVAGCLRTPKGGSAKQIVVAADAGTVRMRWMSPREYARLQGAGDYVISVPPLQAMYGFGDAVCVPVIEWIDAHVLSPRHAAHRAIERTSGPRVAVS